jgi:hypothetical protein
VNETELWRLRGKNGEVVCCAREIHDSARRAWDNSLLAFELRIERNGELYLTELHPRADVVERRSREMREALVEKGWQ